MKNTKENKTLREISKCFIKHKPRRLDEVFAHLCLFIPEDSEIAEFTHYTYKTMAYTPPEMMHEPYALFLDAFYNIYGESEEDWPNWVKIVTTISMGGNFRYVETNT